MDMPFAEPVGHGDEIGMRPVLVVDDSRAQRRLLARTLARWGYRTIEAGSGDEALSICEGVDIEFVISDWLMPGMTGIEFCRRFRETKARRPAYFILLTAQTERERLAEGLESGADDFLSKPFNVTELKARVRAGARVLDAQRDLIAKNRLLRKTLDELEDAQRAIDSDLREARNFQQALVPERHVDLPGAEMSILYRPSGHVGGDLVGYFRVSEARVGLFAIDVAGHGIASALMTARVAAILSGNSPEHNIALTTGGDGSYVMKPPKEVCRLLNRRLFEEFEMDKYLTMLLAELDLTTGQVRLAQAGHPSPIIQRGDGKVSFLESFGLPVGLIEEAEYDEVEATLDVGDRLILYSDGLTECPDPDGSLLDEDGLAAVLRGLADRSGKDLIAGLSAALESFAGVTEFPDDLSALIVQRR